jgi:hypothetical protein
VQSIRTLNALDHRNWSLLKTGDNSRLIADGGTCRPICSIGDLPTCMESKPRHAVRMSTAVR